MAGLPPGTPPNRYLLMGYDLRNATFVPLINRGTGKSLMRHVFRTAVLLSLVTGGMLPLQAQDVTVDQGTFDVRIGDRAAGSESFSIVRTGSGAEGHTTASAQIQIELADATQRMAPLLRTAGLAHTLTRYQLKTAGAEEREVYVEHSGERRLHATVVTSEGQRDQELRFQPDVVVLEAGVAHHFHFLGVRIASGSLTVPVLVPAGRDQGSAQISAGVAEGVEVAGTSVTATRYEVTYGDRKSVV